MKNFIRQLSYRLAFGLYMLISNASLMQAMADAAVQQANEEICLIRSIDRQVATVSKKFFEASRLLTKANEDARATNKPMWRTHVMSLMPHRLEFVQMVDTILCAKPLERVTLIKALSPAHFENCVRTADLFEMDDFIDFCLQVYTAHLCPTMRDQISLREIASRSIGEQIQLYDAQAIARGVPLDIQLKIKRLTPRTFRGLYDAAQALYVRSMPVEFSSYQYSCLEDVAQDMQKKFPRLALLEKELVQLHGQGGKVKYALLQWFLRSANSQLSRKKRFKLAWRLAINETDEEMREALFDELALLCTMPCAEPISFVPLIEDALYRHEELRCFYTRRPFGLVGELSGFHFFYFKARIRMVYEIVKEVRAGICLNEVVAKMRDFVPCLNAHVSPLFLETVARQIKQEYHRRQIFNGYRFSYLLTLIGQLDTDIRQSKLVSFLGDQLAEMIFASKKEFVKFLEFSGIPVPAYEPPPPLTQLMVITLSNLKQYRTIASSTGKDFTRDQLKQAAECLTCKFYTIEKILSFDEQNGKLRFRLVSRHLVGPSRFCLADRIRLAWLLALQESSQQRVDAILTDLPALAIGRATQNLSTQNKAAPVETESRSVLPSVFNGQKDLRPLFETVKAIKTGATTAVSALGTTMSSYQLVELLNFSNCLYERVDTSRKNSAATARLLALVSGQTACSVFHGMPAGKKDDVMKLLDDVCLCILEGADLNEQDAQGNTALHYAILYDMRPLYDLLCLFFKDITMSKKNKNGSTPLHLACQSSVGLYGRSLLDRAPERKLAINTVDAAGHKALHYALIGEPEIVAVCANSFCMRLYKKGDCRQCGCTDPVCLTRLGKIRDLIAMEGKIDNRRTGFTGETGITGATGVADCILS